ncbi:MAG: PAC2 family protein [Thermoplasmata archaeon]|nr:PAC2 family protein [Thermoplasmata archaeon]
MRTLKDVDLKGGTVVAAFPSVGLVSTIVATYLITMSPMDQVTALESADFPSVSMIYAKKPKFPARVYASRAQKLAVFICEMPLPMSTHRPVAYALLKWAADHGARQIVPLEGLPADLDSPVASSPPVWGVGSTDRARAELDKHKIQQLESGMIAGVTAVLLNEGRWRNADVIALLAEARLAMPDASAAVALMRTLDELLPDVTIDLGPLQEQAKALEEQLTKLKQQVRPLVQPEPIPSEMYR